MKRWLTTKRLMIILFTVVDPLHGRMIEMTMKRLMLVCAVMLCLAAAALSESALTSSFDIPLCLSRDGFTPGAVMYLPDFTGTGSRWDVLAVSGDDETVRVTVQPAALSEPADAPDAVCTYEIRFAGVEAGDAFVRLELQKDGVPSWRCNLYVIVDPSLDVKLQSMELMPAFGDITRASIDYGTSDHFTREDMDAAIAVILAEFSAPHAADQYDNLSGFVGFVLHEIRYTSDEYSRRDFETYGIQYGILDHQGQPYVDGIEFKSSFHTPMTDDGWTGFESSQSYSDYNWVLLKTQDGEWEIVTMGY